MKTLGRILIIVTMFVLVMGITYVVVNTNSSSTTATAFERGADGIQPQFPDGERPDFDRAGPMGGWIFGLIKNTGMLAILVAIITVPTSLMRKKAAPERVKGTRI